MQAHFNIVYVAGFKIQILKSNSISLIDIPNAPLVHVHDKTHTINVQVFVSCIR